MARCDIFGEAEIMRQIEALGNPNLGKKVIESAVPIVKRALVEKVRNSHVDTGNMLNSIKETTPVYKASGWYSFIRPTGKDSKGVRNMEKLAYIEFGANNHGQIAMPVIAPAVSSCRKETLQVMQQTFKEETKT